MATTRIIPMHCDKSKSIAKAISSRTDYAKNPDKTRGMELISAYECDPITVDAEFLFSKRIYSDITGRGINKNRDVLAYQIRQSFKPGEVTPEQANQIGYQLAMEFTKGRHQFIVATHEDKEHIHSHIIFNSTTLDCGHKFNNYKNSALNVRKISDRFCSEYGLSVVDNPGKGKHYAEWNAARKGTSWKARLREAIDKYIAISSDFEDMLKRMEADGFTIKRAKYHSYKLPDADAKTRFTGGPSLGTEYTDERIRERIAGRLETPERRTRRQQPQDGRINLLIDIENNIKAQQSAGYARALEIINLKEAAKTLNYLTENNILQYSQLQAKIEEVAAANQQTSDTLKQVEKRIADMGALIKNIELYERTKPFYDRYRQAKNKEHYRQEHESEVILHESARKKLLAIQADNGGKVPNPNMLRAEYDKLTNEKDRLYQEYGKLKNQVKQLDAIRDNVDKILNVTGREPSKEKSRGINI